MAQIKIINQQITLTKINISPTQKREPNSIICVHNLFTASFIKCMSINLKKNLSYEISYVTYLCIIMESIRRDVDAV